MAEVRSLTVPSKINLILKITGKRPDHYHQLQTLFLPLAVPADRVELHWSGPGIRVCSSRPGLPEDLDNLGGRAAQLYAAAAGVAPEWMFRIEKNIPVAAGLGGGSADAAAVLRLLNEHYRILPAAVLTALALQLGADVPFFLTPRPAWAGGIGEELTWLPAELPAVPLLLINPCFPVSSAWAYRHFEPERIGKLPGFHADLLLEAWRAADWEAFGKLLHNDLGLALYEKFPLLEMLRRRLFQLGACGVQISGSGPTMFAVCRDAGSREVLAEALQQEFSDLRCFTAEPYRHF